MDDPGGISRDSIGEAVALASAALVGADDRSHVYFEDREDERVRVSTDGVRECARTRSRGAAVVSRRTIHRADPDLDELVAMARDASNEGRESCSPPLRGGSGPESVGVLRDPLVDRAAAWLTGAAAPHLGAPCVDVEARIVGFNQNVWVGRPDRATLSERRSGLRMEVRARCRNAGRTGEAVVDTVLRPSTPFPDAIVAEAVGRALERTESRAGGRGWVAVPAVLAPAVAGVVVHELVGHALEGDIVAAGRSRLACAPAGLLPCGLTVVDDPRRARAPWGIDDEGTPSRSVALVEGGRVSGVLHDLTSARAAGAPPTGHGRRASYLDRVLPRLGCTYIAQGDLDPGAILRGTREGVYVRRIVAAHADTASGESIFLVTDADIIEQGKLAHALEPFPIVLDLEQSLASLNAIGNDLTFDRCIGSCVRDGQPLAVSVGAPTIRLGVIRAFL